MLQPDPKTKNHKNRSLSLLTLCLALVVVFTSNVFAQGNSQGIDREPEPQSHRSPLTAEDILPATATELAHAMGVPPADLLSADLMGSDPNGVGVSNATLGHWFPSEGNTFAILATGLAADASRPNNEGSLSTILGGLDNDQGNDMVRLHLRLQVPSAYNCANFDFAYYSEEFPEFVGSSFNDTFTAQLNNPSISTEGNEVIAPDNFAFDNEGNIISVNTVFGVTGDTGTTYDGATSRLRASTNVSPGSQINIYLSIQDLGDSIWDSAVFLDRFFWSQDVTCVGGASTDSDGDGLLDDWEINGLTIDGVFVDLPAMGADPNHKDIFIEIDWMGAAAGGHDHAPDPAAIAEIVAAFDNAPVDNPDGTTGIHLHVDYGPGAPLTWGSAATWGSLSDGDELTHQTNISTCSGNNFNWSGFDTIKNANFSTARAAVFHYNVWGHSLCSSLAGTSGISRNGSGATFGEGASDFIVSLGGWPGQTGTQDQQAGTFMHELGHNLGLRHGGDDHTQWKPNYLSVMSYAFQTRGLIINGTEGHFDYSRYDLATLVENNLDESVGINVPGAVPDTLGTRYFCGQDNMQLTNNATAVDWNCDGDTSDSGLSANINQGVSWNNNATLDTLTSQNDWLNLIYSGGAIGAPGANIALPLQSEVIDITEEQDRDIAPNSEGINLRVVTLSGLGIPPNSPLRVPVTFNNYGKTTASNTLLTMTLPPGLTYTSDDSGVTPTTSGNTVVWDMGDLALTDGANFYVWLAVPNVPIGTTYTVDLAITSDGTDTDLSDNSASMNVLVGLPTYLPVVIR